METFRKVIKFPLKNCQHIHPLQQRDVWELTEHIRKKQSVRRIILFGSSLTSNCTIDSDIDLYVEMDEKCRPITEYFDITYDLWTNFNVDNAMLNEIIEKGVIVYDRNDI